MESVFDQIGGTPALRTAVAVLYDRILADPVLSMWFQDTDLRRLKVHQQLFLTAALGGADEFGGRPLTEAHAGMGITHEAFDLLKMHLSASLLEMGVAPDPVVEIIARVETLRAGVVEEMFT